MSTVDPKLLGWIARVVVAGSLVAFVGMAVSQTNAIAPNVASPVAQPVSSPVVAAAGAVAPTTQVAPAGDPTRTTFSLDNDLISTIKWLGWAVVGVLGVFAALTLSFFGIDVRAVRKTLLETQDDLRKKADEVRGHEKSLAELKERLEKLGAELMEAVAKAKAIAASPHPAEEQNVNPPAPEENKPVAPSEGALSRWWFDQEKRAEVLRNHLAAAPFGWSSLDVLMEKTGFSRREIMELAENDPLIDCSVGPQGKTLFRLKEFVGVPADEWLAILRQQAQVGKPTVKSIFPE